MLTFQCWNFTLQNFNSNVAHIQGRKPCIFWCKECSWNDCTIVICLFQQFQVTCYLPVSYVEPSGFLSVSEKFWTILVNSVAIQFLKQLNLCLECGCTWLAFMCNCPDFVSNGVSHQHVYAVLIFLTVNVLSIPLFWNSASEINCFIHLNQNDLQSKISYLWVMEK